MQNNKTKSLMLSAKSGVVVKEQMAITSLFAGSIVCCIHAFGCDIISRYKYKQYEDNNKKIMTNNTDVITGVPGADVCML